MKKATRKYSPHRAMMASVRNSIKHLAIICIDSNSGSEPDVTCIDYRTGKPLALPNAMQLKRILLNETFQWEVACIVCGITPDGKKYAQDYVMQPTGKCQHSDMRTFVEEYQTKLLEEANIQQVVSSVWITRPVPTFGGMTEPEILRILTVQNAWNIPPA